MIDFIPIHYYTNIFFQINLFFVLITLLHTISYTGFTYQTKFYNKVSGWILFTILLVYMGLRPNSWYFGDMINYSRTFDQYLNYGSLMSDPGDVLFYSIMQFFVLIESKTLFFFFIALLYILNIYLACKRLFPNYYYFAFLMLISSFEFWSYGTNGIRNGLATSFILLAFTFLNRKLIMYLLFFIAFNIHSSVLIPIFAFFVTYFYKSEKLYFKIWFLSIFLSLFIGGTIENIITSLGIMDEDILNTYFGRKDEFASAFAYTGFRWDFLAYSASAVGVAYYFIFKRNFKDPYYSLITNIYLVSNAIWILVIQASFSNRFAYLSWFMMGLIIIYPYLTKVFFKNQFKIVGMVILSYFSFTYLMNFILPTF